jgi:hypothetical protein
MLVQPVIKAARTRQRSGDSDYANLVAVQADEGQMHHTVSAHLCVRIHCFYILLSCSQQLGIVTVAYTGTTLQDGYCCADTSLQQHESA